MDTDRLVAASRRAGVTDPRILDAVAAVDRAAFLPPDVSALADEDRPVPIGGGQTTSQPSLIALMVQHLDLPDRATVLEVGTGSGYQTAILARLAARVVGIERDPDLAAAAAERLADLPNVEVVVGDGSRGWPDAAPYDAITVGATGPRVPDALVAQLADGGRLVLPLAEGGHERIALFTRDGEDLVRAQVSLPVRFVPLVGEDAYDERLGR